MSIILEWLSNLPEWLALLIALVLEIVPVLVTFCRTGTVKKLLKKELEEMHLKRGELPVVSEKSYDTEKDVLRFNERTGFVEPTGDKIDIQEQIQSYRSSTFDGLLDKYLPEEALSIKEQELSIFGHSTRRQDVADELNEFYDFAADIRSKYGLKGNNVSVLKQFITEAEKIGTLDDFGDFIVKETEKEVNEDNGKISQETPEPSLQQESVQTDSKEGA